MSKRTPSLAGMAAAVLAMTTLAAIGGSAAAQSSSVSMNIDFFGDASMNDAEVRRAVDSMIRSDVVKLGTLANGGEFTAEKLLYDYRIVRDEEALKALSPILCAANAHICRSTRRAACANTQCIDLGSIARPSAYPVERCRTQALTRKSARVPGHVLCVPALTISVDFTTYPAPKGLGPRELAVLRRQAGGCDPVIANTCAPRQTEDAPVADGELLVRRVRISLPVSSARARKAFDQWYESFRARAVPAAHDLRPEHLRLSVSATAGFGPQQVDDTIVQLVNAPAVELAQNCAANGDCLNMDAFAKMNATKFLNERAGLAASAPWVLAVERRPPVINSAEGEQPHCAVGTLKSEGNRSKLRGAAAPLGLPTQAQLSRPKLRKPTCNAELWEKDATIALEEKEFIIDTNHALAVGGVLSANFDHGGGRIAMGVLPGISVYSLASLGDGDSRAETTGDQVAANGVSRQGAADAGQAALGEKYDTAKNAMDRNPPSIINVSQAMSLWHAAIANEQFLHFGVFEIAAGAQTPLMIAAAGNGANSSGFTLETQNSPVEGQPYSTLATALSSDDFSRGFVERHSCIVWPACLSVQPLLVPGREGRDISPFLISVGGLAADGETPIRKNESGPSSRAPCNDPRDECNFHGPAIDIAAVGEITAPTIAAVARSGRAAPWSSQTWAYQKKSGSSFAAPIVAGLAAALHAKANRTAANQVFFAQLKDSDTCKAARNISPFPEPNSPIMAYLKSFIPAKLVRDRILSSADFASWSGNLLPTAPTNEPSVAASIPNAGGASTKTDANKYSARYAQFGRVNFDAALDFENDCLNISGAERSCSSRNSAYRGPPLTKNTSLNPLFGDANESNLALLPSAMVFKGGELSWTPNDVDEKPGRRKEIVGALQGRGFTIPVADIRRIERIKSQKETDANLFRVVFVDRFDPKTAFALRHIIGTTMAKPGNTTDSLGIGQFRLFAELPLAGADGEFSGKTVPPGQLVDYLSAWPSECGRIYRSGP